MRVLFTYAAAVEAGALPEEFDLEFLELGIGKAAAAIALTRRLSQSPRPDLVLLFGIAGSYDPKPPIGQVCVVRSDCLADEGAATETGFQSLADLGLPGETTFEMDVEATRAASELLGVSSVRGATVSSCSAHDAAAAELVARVGAEVESMEGAAAALACAAFGVPLIQIRAISNRTGDRARSGWDLQGACAQIQSAVTRWIDSNPTIVR